MLIDHNSGVFHCDIVGIVREDENVMNCSQFFLCAVDTDWPDGKHVKFGIVREDEYVMICSKFFLCAVKTDWPDGKHVKFGIVREADNHCKLKGLRHVCLLLRACCFLPCVLVAAGMLFLACGRQGYSTQRDSCWEG